MGSKKYFQCERNATCTRGEEPLFTVLKINLGILKISPYHINVEQFHKKT
jgi:hypothetical protein